MKRFLLIIIATCLLAPSIFCEDQTHSKYEKLNSHDVLERNEALKELIITKDPEAASPLIKLLKSEIGREYQADHVEDVLSILVKINSHESVKSLIELIDGGYFSLEIINALDSMSPDWRELPEVEALVKLLRSNISNHNWKRIPETYECYLKIDPYEAKEYFNHNYHKINDFSHLSKVSLLFDSIENVEFRDYLIDWMTDPEKICRFIPEVLDKFFPGWMETEYAQTRINEFNKYVMSLADEYDLEDALWAYNCFHNEESLLILVNNTKSDDNYIWEGTLDTLVDIDDESTIKAVKNLLYESGELRKWTDDNDWELEKSIKCLGQIDSPESKKLLMELLQSEKHKSYAAKALAGFESKEGAKTLIDELKNNAISYRHDGYYYELEESITSLVQMGEKEAIPALALWIDKNDYIAINALNGLNELDPDNISEHCLSVLEHSSNKWTKLRAIEILGEKREFKALPFLQKLVKNENPDLRAVAEWALYRIKSVQSN